jgi:hypothetical protein
VSEDGKPARRSWNTKIPTDGGPVDYLNIFDRQAEIRLPEELRMGDNGTYRYSYTEHKYRWLPKRRPDGD